MATKQRTTKSADAVILDVLRNELASDDHAKAEGKIRRRLRYYSAGPYRQERVDLLRRLKDELQGEIHLGERSRYYVGRHGNYVAMEDFDVQRMTMDLAQSYLDVPEEVIAAFVRSAVIFYYLL